MSTINDDIAQILLREQIDDFRIVAPDVIEEVVRNIPVVKEMAQYVESKLSQARSEGRREMAETMRMYGKYDQRIVIDMETLYEVIDTALERLEGGKDE